MATLGYFTNRAIGMEGKELSKRARVLEVATKLFASRGFDGTPVRKIAEEAGLSVAGMFHYFSSKEEILFDIVIVFLDEGLRKLRRICESDKDPVAKLEEVCEFFAEYFAGHQDQLRILSSEGKALSLEHQQVFKERQRQYVALIRRLLEDLVRQGVAKDIDPTVMAFLFFGMVLWTSHWYNPQGKVKPDELGRILGEVFLRGILKERGDG